LNQIKKKIKDRIVAYFSKHCKKYTITENEGREFLKWRMVVACGQNTQKNDTSEIVNLIQNQALKVRFGVTQREPGFMEIKGKRERPEVSIGVYENNNIQ